MVASTRTAATQHTGEVTGAIAQQRHSLATQRGEYQFANLTIRYGFQRLWVNNLYDVVVLPEMQTILLLTFEAYARAAHLTHAKGVVGLHAQHLLDALALLLRMRLSTNGQHFQFGIATWVNALFLHHLVETGDV